MSGSGKDVSGMVGISWDEVGAGTFPDTIPVEVEVGIEEWYMVVFTMFKAYADDDSMMIKTILSGKCQFT